MLLDEATHLFDCFHLCFLSHIDPVFELLVHRDELTTCVPQVLERPVSDLDKAVPVDALLALEGLLELLSID